MDSENDMENNEGDVPTMEGCGKAFEVVSEALHRTSSRRLMMTGGLGAVMGGMLAQSAQAAPSDIQGSPNVAIRSYKNEEGIFVLWADGRITNAKSGQEVGNPSNYSTPNGFTAPKMVKGRPAGSPNVAVDVLQDENGTYVLFADGSVRQPPLAGAGARGFGDWELFSGHIGQGKLVGLTPNISVSGNVVKFDKPFREKPFIWLYWRDKQEHYILWTDYPGFVNPTTTSWNAHDYVTFGTGKIDGGFWGMGLL
jgi:prepilin-type processing-associated H-X9-DG protein